MQRSPWCSCSGRSSGCTAAVTHAGCGDMAGCLDSRIIDELDGRATVNIFGHPGPTGWTQGTVSVGPLGSDGAAEDGSLTVKCVPYGCCQIHDRVIDPGETTSWSLRHGLIPSGSRPPRRPTPEHATSRSGILYAGIVADLVPPSDRCCLSWREHGRVARMRRRQRIQIVTGGPAVGPQDGK